MICDIAEPSSYFGTQPLATTNSFWDDVKLIHSRVGVKQRGYQARGPEFEYFSQDVNKKFFSGFFSQKDTGDVGFFNEKRSDNVSAGMKTNDEALLKTNAVTCSLFVRCVYGSALASFRALYTRMRYT